VSAEIQSDSHDVDALLELQVPLDNASGVELGCASCVSEKISRKLASRGMVNGLENSPASFMPTIAALIDP
jgi:hypothetical protein